MPKVTHDIVEAASRVFHFNSAELFPKFIVIRSEHRKAFAITTIESFRLQQAAQQTDDWQIALNISSEDLLALMGQVPRNTSEPDTCTTGVPQPDADLAPAGAIDEATNASGA